MIFVLDTKGKIVISDLANSDVIKESIKEKQAKKKKEDDRKAKLEDGELSDCNSDSQRRAEGADAETKDSRSRKKRHPRIVISPKVSFPSF